MAATVESLRTQLLSTAAALGAGTYVLDDAVDRVLGRAAATDCKSLTFVNAAVAASTKNLVGGGALGQVQRGVHDAIKAATCGSVANPLTKAAFTSRLQQVAAKTVVGYPVGAAAGGGGTFLISLGPYTERQVRVAVPKGSWNAERSARLRFHSDGTARFMGAHNETRGTLTVASVSPVQGRAGWVTLGLRAGQGAALKQATYKGSASVGQKAVVFLHPTTGAVTKVVRVSGAGAGEPSPTPEFDYANTGELTPEQMIEKLARELEEVRAQATATPVPTDSPSEQPVDPVTGAPVATRAPGISLDITVGNDNNSENENENENDRPMRGPVVGPIFPDWPVLVEEEDPVATSEPEATEEPDDGYPPEPPCPPQYCPPAPRCPEGLDKEGTFFCMTKRTMFIVMGMLLLASCLVGLGYYIYRKKAGAPPATGGGAGGGGFDDLGLGGLGDLGGPRP